MRRILTVLILIMTIVSCKRKDLSDTHVTCLTPVPDTAQLLSGMMKSVRFIPLETTSRSLIGGRIEKIKKINNKYYVNSDRKELLEFDENGLFIRKIGHTGSGPGEYTELSDYDVFENGNILIQDGRKLIFYDMDGKYQHSVMLKIMAFNIKIVNDRILAFGSGEKYAIYELDLSGKIINNEFKSNYATRLGRPIAFITYGQDKIIIHIGNSNDFIFYDLNDKSFSYTKLLCDDNILSSIREEELHQTHNGNYESVYGGMSEQLIFTMAGSNSSLLFLYGQLMNNDKKYIQVLNISNGNTEHVISMKDIDDVTFTNPFFILNSWTADASDCFISYVYPDAIWAGCQKHNNFKDHPYYNKLEKLLANKSEDEIMDENPILVEFVFK
jgi:hypothetical protein